MVEGWGSQLPLQVVEFRILMIVSLVTRPFLRKITRMRLWSALGYSSEPDTFFPLVHAKAGM